MDKYLSSSNKLPVADAAGKPLNQTSLEDQLTTCVLSDLNSQLSKFKNQKIALQQLSLNIGLHKKTLERLFQGKHKPSYQTLIKIYSFLHKENNLQKLMEMVPSIVQDEIKRYSPTVSDRITVSPQALEELNKNEIALAIYAICGSGSVSLKQIKKTFGEYGVKSLNKLLKFHLIEEGPKNNFKVGSTQVALDPALLKKISEIMIGSFFRPQESDLRTGNYIGYVTEGVSEAAYQQLLVIDRQCFEQKMKLIDDPDNSGSVRLFSIQISDRIELDNSVPSVVTSELH